jgi:hypothetical protein
MGGTAEFDVMRRLTGCVGAMAMFLALLTAPLYHLHDRDDHGEPVSVVHAHLPEGESPDHHSESSVEDRHSDRNARYVDVFTLSTPPAAIDLAVELTTTSFVLLLEVDAPLTIEPVPQSHGPPSSRPSAPRPPPTA